MLSSLSKVTQALNREVLLGKSWNILPLRSVCQMAVIPASVTKMNLINCYQESVCHEE